MTYTIRVYNPVNENWIEWATGIDTEAKAQEIAKEAEEFLTLRVEVVKE